MYIDDVSFTDAGSSTTASRILQEVAPAIAIVEDGNEANNTILRNSYTIEYYGSSG